VLDDITISKIAAGEIIENPASIVKELVENSIDAKSRSITVEINSGGIDYIRVTDDGFGISDADLPLAFTRHATSKINNIDDLYNTVSLGFRGEALASIASAAKVEVITKTEDKIAGTHGIINSDGTINEISQIGSLTGTSIIVTELFYNMPVRKKFLKSSNYEANQVSNLLIKLALSHPEISFKFIRDGKVGFNTNNQQSYINNLYQVLGKSIARNLHNINYEDEQIRVYGYISDNILFRANRSHQYIFVNNRTIKNTDITYNIERAYQSYIPLNRYPVFILYIDINPGLIDVNIHPSKEEIKIDSDINESVMSKINMIIRERISEIVRIPDKVDKAPKINIFSEYLEKERTSNEINLIDLSDDEVKDDTSSYDAEHRQPKEVTIEKNVFEYQGKEDKREKTPIIEIVQESLIEESVEENKLFTDYYRYVGTLFKNYLIIEDGSVDSFYFIDQHAAHERILYEQFKTEFENDEINTQILMSTELVYLSIQEVDILREIKDDLSSLGIEFDFYGDNAVVIREVPVFLKNITTEGLFKEILDSSEKIKSIYHVDLYKIMKIACVHAVKSGDTLSNIEVKELIERLQRCENPLACPHGRPTIIKYKKSWLEKEFFRIQS
ncbi:MAG: DNA mismatch repair endonuclease MutL, partial [Tissierellia bacterium]|nr:DNA mismatch repair endonuclease MutL [Tissierellia bacterium]